MWDGCSLLAVCFYLGHALLGLGFSVPTACFHMCQSLLVPVYSLRAHSGVTVACCQLACNLLPAWSQRTCAWTQCESMFVWACGLVSVCLESVSSLVTLCLCLGTLWEHCLCPCSWIQCESSVCGPVSSLLIVCLQLIFSLAPASMCLDPILPFVSSLLTLILCLGPI